MAEEAKNQSEKSFYARCSPMRTLAAVCDPAFYVEPPADWYLAVGDIESSTRAVETGRHPDVNFAAAGMITALTNLCGPIPFQFGGDGAIALLPPDHAAAARRELARARRFVRQDLDLNLRVGLISLAELKENGGAVLVGRYEPTNGNACGQFLGNGIDLFEQALKGRGDETLRQHGLINEGEDDGEPSNLTGLSCRWNPLRSIKGRIVSLVTRGSDPASLHRALLRIAGLDILKAASQESLSVRFPPKGLMREARARRDGRSLPAAVLKVTVETILSFVSFNWNIRIGGFDPARYRRELLSNLIDFSRCGDAFNIVFDCPMDRIEPLRAYLQAEAAADRLRFGMHVSETALMTCLVKAADEGLHVHFADGGGGGFTRAARALKRTA